MNVPIKSNNATPYIILLVLVVALVAAWTFDIIKIPSLQGGKISTQDSVITSNNLKLDSLRNVIKGLESNQARYDSSIARLQDSLVVLNSQIAVNENKIKDIRKKYNEKVNGVSNYSSNQLEEFLSGRYK